MAGTVRRRHEHPVGPEHPGTLGHGPVGVRDVVQHVIGDDDIEGVVDKGQLLGIGHSGLDDLERQRSGPVAGGIDHPDGQIGQCQTQTLGKVRRAVRPQPTWSAPDLQNVWRRRPVDLRHQPWNPGTAAVVYLTCRSARAVSLAGSLYCTSRRYRWSRPMTRSQVPAMRAKSAMLAAVSRLMSGHTKGKISVPWIVPMTWRQRASTPAARANGRS